MAPPLLTMLRAGCIRKSGILTQAEAKMSKMIAPRGENRASELREVLVRLAEAADEAIGFISRYAEVWELADQVLMEKNLWNFEPYFTELMDVFHCAMEDLQNLVGENPEGQRLLVKFPLIQRGDTSICYIRLAMRSISWMVRDWIATHPEEKDSLLIRAAGYLLDRMSDRAVVRVGVIALLMHWHWVLTPKERDRLEKNDWE